LELVTNLADLDVVGVLKAGGQLLPGGGHGLAVTTPGGKELDKVGPCGEEEKKKKRRLYLILENIIYT
jgi:hypothetical protein